ncbi:hypothetical protein NKG94_23260 [Micromonospora sp. M12]
MEQVVVAQVTASAPVFTESTLLTPRLVIVDTAAFQRLLATTRCPTRRRWPGSRHPAPGRPRAGPFERRRAADRHAAEASRDDAPAIRLAAVGTAPSVGGTDDVVIVDATALADAGLPAVPNTVWVTGPARRGPCRTPASPPTSCCARTSCGRCGWLR